MREDYTHITVVLDSSGSMSSILNDTIGGFNTFLKAQKEAPGYATFSLIQFANDGHSYGRRVSQNMNWGGGGVGVAHGAVGDGFYQCASRIVHDFKDIKEIKELTTESFRPVGGTPLLDTIGESIISVGQKLAAMPEAVRPSKVLFVIITDGEENQSTKFHRERIMGMIKEQTDAYKWNFMFLGANQDAIAVARQVGIAAGSSLSYGTSRESLDATYHTLALKTAMYRSAAVGSEMYDASLNFSDAERAGAMGANASGTVI